ncbi:hypothetical protein CCR75_007178 [Bremia lactucae]|uniref:ZZ-type domain-containing protein n=1 Tax=Bremia lactucae TaxID=4779 RepID=A0A976FMY8_BRELC|nr:hypothetical protein CCR75_007178 [Bremia lactucae]
MTTALQHNFAALQAQLETLQLKNSALTRDLCLKENYIELKDQHLCEMQRRLEEIEGAAAQWKDRWLQIKNAQQAKIKSAKCSNDNADDREMDRFEDAKWVSWKCKSGTANRTKAVAQAVVKLEKLSQTDRNKLQPLLMAIEQDRIEKLEDFVFTDVSEELSRILLLYLLPALLTVIEGTQNQLQCFSRTYYKQTMDFKVGMRQPVQLATVSGMTEKFTASRADFDATSPPMESPTLISFIAGTCGAKLNLASQRAEEIMETEASHLFDCVELDRRGIACQSVSHGPRELHSTKAILVSRPMNALTAASAVALSVKKAKEKPATRRYTLTPKRSGPTFAVETRRPHTMTIGALPSPAQSPSSTGAIPLAFDGEVLPLVPREKDGKIKKIVGSVFDRLSRHKSQSPQASTIKMISSSQASPVSLSGSIDSSVSGGIDDNSICNGCGRGPLSNAKWVCRTCLLREDQLYELCEKCYSQGIHGKEHEDALFARVEAIVIRKCPQLESETNLLSLLRIGICKANVKKFSFCLTWIADLLQCHRTSDLRARALEVAHVPSIVRSEFTRLLRELLTRLRPDIELKTEWQPVAGAQYGTLGPDVSGVCNEGVPDDQDTLKIFVKDAPLMTMSSSKMTRNGTPRI